MAIVVAVAGAGDVVVQGLWDILREASDLEVIDEYPLGSPHVGTLPDVVVYDVLALHRDEGAELADLINGRQTAVVVLGRELRPDLALRPAARGAAGYVSLEASACEIVSVIREAAGGQWSSQDAPALGCEAGLTNREAKILGDVVQGFSNAEIARRQMVTANTVKSYIRTTYRKIGATSRAQAVSWGLRHGFDPSAQSVETLPISDSAARGRLLAR
jgi:DNA-binding NarL/FixJ family response regulator